jgi:hypothetical protein
MIQAAEIRFLRLGRGFTRDGRIRKPNIRDEQKKKAKSKAIPVTGRGGV